MRKLKLNVEQLEVTSFETRGEMAEAGTVAAMGNITAATEDEGSCGHPQTCYIVNTCRPSCAYGSCAAVCQTVTCGVTGVACGVD